MRFAYYDRLSKRDQEIYRQSDRVAAIELERPETLAPRVEAVRVALAADDQAAVTAAAQSLADGICDKLAVPPVDIEVLAVRPKLPDDAELHGLYTADDDAERPMIQLWMRTAAKGRVVAFRTFVRTLLHELCHHFDYELLGLENSFHTEGFFKRESSLARALLPPKTAA
jgi:hypothetical protein